MPEITVASGSAETFADDTLFLAQKWFENPKIITARGSEETTALVLEKVSALFIEPNLVVVLQDPGKATLDRLAGALKQLSRSVPVIIYTTAIKEKKTRKEAEAERGERFKNKVRSMIRAHGKTMTNDAFDLLRKRVTSEVILEGEMEKLINYVGNAKGIKAKDVAAIVTESHEEDFIALLDALLAGNKKRTMTIVDGLLMQGAHILEIHGAIVRRLRLLLQAKDAEQFFKGGGSFSTFSKDFDSLKERLQYRPADARHYLPYQKPYFAYNLANTSARFTRKTLIDFLDALAAFDERVKKGTRQEHLHLESTLLGA